MNLSKLYPVCSGRRQVYLALLLVWSSCTHRDRKRLWAYSERVRVVVELNTLSSNNWLVWIR